MELKKRYNNSDLQEFANQMKQLSRKIGFKVSARGWAYILEQNRMINKDEFNKVNKLINNCRKKGFLPIDFVAEESARQFSGIEKVDNHSLQDDMISWLNASLNTAHHYNLDWWENEEYYIQMVVEKIDLVTLFSPVCSKYHIPIANSKGWSSILQRAEYAKRFKEAQDKGLKCVLLYCGDHDPDGLRISEFLRKNLEDVEDVFWEDGTIGYDPSDLIIDRFGLNYDFIQKNKFTWIDNLITGSGRNLASPSHPNFEMEYVKHYLKTIGERKCEANVIVTLPEISKKLCASSIETYLGKNAVERFENKRQSLVDSFDDWLEETGVRNRINKVINICNENL